MRIGVVTSIMRHACLFLVMNPVARTFNEDTCSNIYNSFSMVGYLFINSVDTLTKCIYGTEVQKWYISMSVVFKMKLIRLDIQSEKYTQNR